MNYRNCLAIVVAGVFCLTGRAVTADVTIVDGDFNTWLFGSIADGGSSASITREADEGNPGARLNATTITPSGKTASGLAVKDDFSTMVPLEGTAATLTLDVKNGPGASGQGQLLELVVVQENLLYVQSLAGTGLHSDYDTLTFNTVLDANTFLLVSGIGPEDPDLTGGVATRFGFAVVNSSSQTLTQFYDNFTLTIVPEPATLTVLAFGGLAFAPRRRRA